jgi:hypothetical protein
MYDQQLTSVGPAIYMIGMTANLIQNGWYFTLLT